MKRARIALLTAAAAIAVAIPALAQQQQPARHLVFNFGITLATTRTVHTSGIDGDGPISGTVNARTGNTDTGTISADVIATQPDSGLVVRIAEQGHTYRNTEPIMCVTYGTGTVLCDMTKGGPTEEEMSLLRVLGRDFLNPATMDSKRHWHSQTDGAGSTEKDDYTVDAADGDVYRISFERLVSASGAKGFEATTEGHIVYNLHLNVRSA